MGTSKGFTLIEILVATVILFFAVSSLVGLISTNSLLLNKVEKRFQLHSQVPYIVAEVKQQIHVQVGSERISGEGATPILNYKWTAVKRISSKEVTSFSEQEGFSANTFQVFDVSIVINMDKVTRNYSFSTLNWVSENDENQ